MFNLTKMIDDNLDCCYILVACKFLEIRNTQAAILIAI